VVIEARRRTPDGPTAVGFTATKKIGGAVVRNRAKRRLREAGRALLPRHGLAGVAYVFIARDGTAAAPWAALLDDVRTALIRLAAQVDGRDPRRSGASTTTVTALTPPPSEVSAPHAARALSRPEDDEA
jgi:ribonuclease P protein component